METTTQQLTPATIMHVGLGFWSSKVMLAAVNQGLFTHLAQKPLSVKEIKTLLGWNCSDRHASDFLDTLFAMKFLQREGIGATAIYSNSEETDFFLDKNKHSYIGGILEMANNRLFRFWANLEDGLKTGLPQNEVRHGSENFFATIYKSPELLREFVNAMSGISIGNFSALAKKFDFSKYQTLCDIGGAAGMLCIQVASQHPHMNCTSYDLAPVEPIAKETIEKFGLAGKVKTAQGDFFTDKFPNVDVITMGLILHDWNEEKKRMLIKKAFEALPEGGAFIAIENIIDNERAENVFGLTMSLNMLIETGDGFDFTLDDFSKWTKAAGFKRVEQIHLAGPTSAAIAYK